jgi:hypothetical protein
VAKPTVSTQKNRFKCEATAFSSLLAVSSHRTNVIKSAIYIIFKFNYAADRPIQSNSSQANFLPWRECCERCQCAADENFNTASVQLWVWGWWKKFVCQQSKVLLPLLCCCSQPGWETTYLIFAMFLCVANNLFIHDCIFRRKLC